MEPLLYLAARTLVALLQALPLTWVARLGRLGGALAYQLDARHRRVVLRNLTMCFGRERAPAELRALARENFRRIGENYASSIKTAALDFAALQSHVQFVGVEKIPSAQAQSGHNLLIAIGHFGNFELYARFGEMAAGYQCATTYRALPQVSLNRLLQQVRGRSGCLYFERRTEGRALKAALQRGGLILGFLADQHAGQNGYRLPFLGHEGSTSTGPAVFALRYGCPLFTAICYRVALAQWRIEIGDEIPTREHGRARPTLAIMGDIHRAFEAAVRRDPANWFWVHNRWKTPGREPRGHPAAALEE